MHTFRCDLRHWNKCQQGSAELYYFMQNFNTDLLIFVVSVSTYFTRDIWFVFGRFRCFKTKFTFKALISTTRDFGLQPNWHREWIFGFGPRVVHLCTMPRIHSLHHLNICIWILQHPCHITPAMVPYACICCVKRVRVSIFRCALRCANVGERSRRFKSSIMRSAWAMNWNVANCSQTFAGTARPICY